MVWSKYFVMHVPNEMYYIGFKAQLVTFEALPFTIYTLVSTVPPKVTACQSLASMVDDDTR
jgi:hypothetical protein